MCFILPRSIVLSKNYSATKCSNLLQYMVVYHKNNIKPENIIIDHNVLQFITASIQCSNPKNAILSASALRQIYGSRIFPLRHIPWELSPTSHFLPTTSNGKEA